MLATPVAIGRSSRTGPRPINLGRDSHQVLLLLDLVFGPLTDARGRRLITERVSLSYASPLRVRLSMLTEGFVPGFVWEQDGHIVGNLSLIASELPGRYLIANVVVHPDFRRRGIARALLREALDHIDSLEGKEVMLQVEHDNEGAIGLYEQHGFQALGVVNRWQTSSTRLAELDPGAVRVDIRELRRSDWREAYRLDVASLAPELNWPTPPLVEKYRRGLLRPVSDFLNGSRTETWVAYPGSERRQGRSLPGLIHMHSQWAGPYYIELRVHPNFKGRLERPLLAKAIRRLRHLRGRVIRHNHPVEDELASQLLIAANFKAVRTLTIMRRSFGAP